MAGIRDVTRENFDLSMTCNFGYFFFFLSSFFPLMFLPFMCLHSFGVAPDVLDWTGTSLRSNTT